MKKSTHDVRNVIKHVQIFLKKGRLIRLWQAHYRVEIKCCYIIFLPDKMLSYWQLYRHYYYMKNFSHYRWVYNLCLKWYRMLIFLNSLMHFVNFVWQNYHDIWIFKFVWDQTYLLLNTSFMVAPSTCIVDWHFFSIYCLSLYILGFIYIYNRRKKFGNSQAYWPSDIM